MRNFILRWLFPDGSPKIPTPLVLDVGTDVTDETPTSQEVIVDALEPVMDGIQSLQSAVDANRDEFSEVVDGMKKLTRSNGRTALRVEEIERKVEEQTTALRALIAAAKPSGDPDSVPNSKEPAALPSLDALLDALDLLDHAALAIDSTATPGVSEGLHGVSRRLAGFLTANGLSRIAPVGELPDGKLFRVVGSESEGTVPAGHISRVVRAAVRHGDKLVREGEVLTLRKNTEL